MLFVFFNFTFTQRAFRTYLTFVSCIRVLHPHAVMHPSDVGNIRRGSLVSRTSSFVPCLLKWPPGRRPCMPPDSRQADCSLYPADPSMVKPGHTVVLSVCVIARTQRCKRASAFCIHLPFCIHCFYVLTTVCSLRTTRASTVCIHTPFCILVCTVCTGRCEHLCIHPALCASTFCRSLVAATAFGMQRSRAWCGTPSESTISGTRT